MIVITVSSEISYSEVSHCLQEKSNFTFSKMLATAKIDDGDTSSSFLAIDLNRFSAVSLRPSLTSQNLSVFAVHKTITCKRQDIGHCQNKFVKLPNSFHMIRHYDEHHHDYLQLNSQ